MALHVRWKAACACEIRRAPASVPTLVASCVAHAWRPPDGVQLMQLRSHEGLALPSGGDWLTDRRSGLATVSRLRQCQLSVLPAAPFSHLRLTQFSYLFVDGPPVHESTRRPRQAAGICFVSPPRSKAFHACGRSGLLCGDQSLQCHG